MRIFIVLFSITLLSGCYVYTNRQNALDKVGWYERRGFNMTADSMRREAMERDDTPRIGFGSPESAAEKARRDSMFIPEYDAYRGDRYQDKKYDIKISTFNDHR